jgi:hypothetical protein
LQVIPYIGIIEGGFLPGKMVRVQGTVLAAASGYLSLFVLYVALLDPYVV